MSAACPSGKFEFGNVGSHGFCDLSESDAEEADDDGEDFVSGGKPC